MCESEQAIYTVQQRNRELLKAIAREQPQLYAELGQAFSAGARVLARTSASAEGGEARPQCTGGEDRAATIREVEHA